MTADDALLELLTQLQARNYRFTTVTPETHKRVLARPTPNPLSLRDIFGWSRPFQAADVETAIVDLLRRGEALDETTEGFRSQLRVASLDDRLFFHSSFPTETADSVFFGPDTYRFCAFIKTQLAAMKPPSWIVDMGSGCGAGGVIAASLMPAARVTLVDINPEAARLARVNARVAGVDVEVTVTDRIPSGCDLVIANPPYMIDIAHRTYRDGRGLRGGEVALDWVHEALGSLIPGGTMLLYSGAAMVNGASPLLEEIASLTREQKAKIAISDLDPDVFGEELSRPDYVDVERIAAVGVTVVKRVRDG